jgi:hypothetical protein
VYDHQRCVLYFACIRIDWDKRRLIMDEDTREEEE